MYLSGSNISWLPSVFTTWKGIVELAKNRQFVLEIGKFTVYYRFMENALKKAIRLAGSQSALARVVGISAQALGKQIHAGVIRPKHCLKIEKAFPGDISRYDLNPEHFGKPPSADCMVIVLQSFEAQNKTI